MSVLDFLKTYAPAFQILLGIGAAGAAIYWWRTRREHFPRVKVDHLIDHVVLEGGKHLLRVTLHIENMGRVFFPVGRVIIYVQQIEPCPYFAPHGEAKPFDYRRDATGREIDWPTIAQGDFDQQSDSQSEFEPGETGPLTYDFLLDEMPSVISVYTHISNPKKSGTMGWVSSKIFRMNMKKDPAPDHLQLQTVAKQAPQPVTPKPSTSETRTQTPIKAPPPASVPKPPGK